MSTGIWIDLMPSPANHPVVESKLLQDHRYVLYQFFFHFLIQNFVKYSRKTVFFSYIKNTDIEKSQMSFFSGVQTSVQNSTPNRVLHIT